MENQVLIAYATKYGATMEIARKIGRVLHETGLDNEVMPASDVYDLSPYKTVILGSAVYMGRWQKTAAKFLISNEKILVDKNLWLFSSGPVGDGDPVELLQGWKFPKGLITVAQRTQPRDITVFHGNLDIEKINFFEKWIVKKIKSPVGDFRDWEDITLWAKGIAHEIIDSI